jgi:glycosyltransferase involved in cell wall biosynthesis
MSSKRLAIIVSHPIQYYAPLFAFLSKSITLKVFYAFQPNPQQQGKDGFGKAFQWDLDLLKGYKYEFLNNVAKDPSSSSFGGCDTPDIGDQIQKYGASHVICFGWHLKMYRQALAHCKEAKLPVAVRGDSQIDPNQVWYKRLLKQLYYPFFLSRFDYFLSVGERNKSYLKKYGVPEDKIFLSPHAVDQDFWKVVSDERSRGFKFIWVAKFIDKKRPKDVILAFKKLLKDHPEYINNIELNMVGTGELLEQCKALGTGIEELRFSGFKNQKELRDEYARSNCLLLSSDYRETWGLVVNEAFSCGLPAIVSDACGCAADLIEGKCGLVYKMGNVDQLSSAMYRILQEQSDQETLRERALSISEKNRVFSFQHNRKAFQAFLKA